MSVAHVHSLSVLLTISAYSS